MIRIENIVADGDFGSIPGISSRALSKDNYFLTDSMRQTSIQSYLQLAINGATHNLEANSKCAGALVPIISPLFFEIPVVDLETGVLGFKFAYKLIGEYGNG